MTVIDVAKIEEAKAYLRSLDDHLHDLENVQWLVKGNLYRIPSEVLEEFRFMGLSVRDIPELIDLTRGEFVGGGDAQQQPL